MALLKMLAVFAGWLVVLAIIREAQKEPPPPE